jgi:hypothetical protein
VSALDDSLALSRERVIQALCHHFAHDRLTTDELEVRLSRAHQARTAPELDALLTGLPQSSALPVPVLAPLPAHADATEAPESMARLARTAGRSIDVLFTEQSRTGDWLPPAELRVSATFSGLTLDYTETAIPPDHQIHVDATFAEVKIIVPPGVRVVCRGSGFLGEFSTKKLENPADPFAPTIYVDGMAILGAVTIKPPKRAAFLRRTRR